MNDVEVLILSYVKYMNQIVNVFIKSLSIGNFEKNVGKLNLFNLYVDLRATLFRDLTVGFIFYMMS